MYSPVNIHKGRPNAIPIQHMSGWDEQKLRRYDFFPRFAVPGEQ
jgi:hypothetical protein